MQNDPINPNSQNNNIEDDPNKDKELEAIKNHYSLQKKRKREADKIKLNADTENLIQEMLTASKDDFTAIKEGKMGISKVRLLSKVKEVLKTELTWETFIKNDGVKIFNFWITPHPSDKILPCNSVIKTVLVILCEMDITEEVLVKSGIGKKVT